MRKFICLFIAILMAGAVLSGCTAKTAETDNGKPNIVTTIFPVYDFTRAIVGDRANLSMLIKPGASVHSFDPTPSDIAKVQNADIFIYIGGESDVWADNILDSLDQSKIRIVRLMESVNAVEEEVKEGMEEEEEEEEEGTAYDEHIWTSPQNAVKMIDTILSAVSEQDGENSALYQSNAKTYQDALKEADSEIAGIVSGGIRKKIVVADKFPFIYFVKQYGLDYEAAFPGCSDQADAGAATIAHLVNAVKDEGIPCVYYVELSNQNVAKAINEETGAEMLLLHSGQNVTKTDFDAGVTFLSLLKQNAENLKKGLLDE